MLTDTQDRDAIFSRAIEIASAEERGAYIARACGDDAVLRRQVEEQVAAHFHAGHAPKPTHPAAVNHSNGHDGSPTHIGPYHLLKQIGEGGAGIVFLAEQREPAQRRVALKVIKVGIDWRQVVAGFESERPTLARVDHPAVARILDAGVRSSGQPYFVQELIEGIPLTKYCDGHRLSLPQRLELFVSVCHAVQHAHHKGAFHGGLKPSNVLVAGREGNPAIKLVDLGLARAAAHKLSERTPSAVPSGRPEYLSPEQAAVNTVDIDTRSDVYSLGVLLYELLTGTTPLPRERLKDVPITEALRLVREEKATTPSTRLSELQDGLTAVAAQRHTDPTSLVKTVRGELDCVVLKALEKDRTRRYQTVSEFAREVERYLAGEPVEAFPPGAKYRLWKWARKCSRGLAAAGVLLVVLAAAGVAGAVLTVRAQRAETLAQKTIEEATVQSKQAKKTIEESESQRDEALTARKTTASERDEALAGEKAAQRAEENMKAVLTFLEDRVLSAGRPAGILTDGQGKPTGLLIGGQGKDVTLRKALDAAEAKVAESFPDRPLVEASVRAALGSAYLDLEAPELAVTQYERALALRDAWLGPDHPEAIACRNKLNVAYRQADRTDEAGRLYDENRRSSPHASALAIRGAVLLAEKKPAEAETKLRECLTIRTELKPEDWTTFEAQSLLGEALTEQKKYAEAEPLLLSGYQGMKQREDKIPEQGRTAHLTSALVRLQRLDQAQHKKDRAAQWQKELRALQKTDKP